MPFLEPTAILIVVANWHPLSQWVDQGFNCAEESLADYSSYAEAFSAWKEDILQVNGFNESMESYWGEVKILNFDHENKNQIGNRSVDRSETVI